MQRTNEYERDLEAPSVDDMQQPTSRPPGSVHTDIRDILLTHAAGFDGPCRHNLEAPVLNRLHQQSTDGTHCDQGGVQKLRRLVVLHAPGHEMIVQGQNGGAGLKCLQHTKD